MDAARKPKKTQVPMGDIATIKNGRDITRGYVDSLLLEPQDRILRHVGYDYEVYERILEDPQVESCFQQRRKAVVSRETRVEPGGEKRIDKQAADDLQKTLDRIGWDAISDKMLFGVFYGFAAGECIWDRDGDRVMLETIKVKKQRRFKFNPDGELRLLTLQNMVAGEPLPPRKFWSFCTGADNDDEPYGKGLGHWLYYPTLFKRTDVKFWLLFLEKFAQPTGKGKYQPGATKEEQKKLLQAVGAIATEAGIILPEGMDIELLEASRNGTSDYQALYEKLDEAIAKIILSQTMTTDNGSSRSQSETHMAVRQEVVKADSDLVCESFNRGPARWLTDWNYPGAAYPRVWRVIEDEPDLKPQAERDAIIIGWGFQPKPEYVQATYGDNWVMPEGDASEPQVPLNGAQVQVLADLVSKVAAGQLSVESGRQLVTLSFPSITEEMAIKLLPDLPEPAAAPAEGQPDPLAGDQPDQPATPIATLDQAAALFAESIDFAATKTAKAPAKKPKSCKKGIACGGSCISAKKVCKSEMTPPQKAKRDETVKAAGGEVAKPKAAAKPKAEKKPAKPKATKEKAVPKAEAAGGSGGEAAAPETAKPKAEKKPAKPKATKEKAAPKAEAVPEAAAPATEGSNLTSRPNTGSHEDLPEDGVVLYQGYKLSSKKYVITAGGKPKEVYQDEFSDFVDKYFDGDVSAAISGRLDNMKMLEAISANAGISLKEAKIAHDAIIEFTGSAYRDIRNYERGAMDLLSDDPVKVKARVDAINNYITKAPTYKGEVYRGLSFDSEEARQGFLKSLESEPLNAMCSHSSKISVARNFAKGGIGKGLGVIVKVKNNRSGVSIQNISIYKGDEAEVLVPKGARYRIVGSKTVGKNIEVEVEEID